MPHTEPPPAPDIVALIQAAGYTLKNVKTWYTHDGGGWAATLYHQGKRIGYANNSGHGGPSTCDFVSDELRKAFDAWTATLPDIVVPACKEMEAFSLRATEDGVLEELFNLWAQAKEIKTFNRMAKTKLLFRTASDDDNPDSSNFKISFVKPSGGADPNAEATRARYRAAPWWPDVTHVWVIGQGWVAEPASPSDT